MLCDPGGKRALAASAGTVEQDVAYRPVFNERGKLSRSQDGVATGEAAQRHDRLIGLQDDGIRLVRADYGDQVLRAAFVRFEVLDERAIGCAVSSSKTTT